jgi:hydroxymethylpyrimidine/phosphomethylpyrimidine kinase
VRQSAADPPYLIWAIPAKEAGTISSLPHPAYFGRFHSPEDENARDLVTVTPIEYSGAAQDPGEAVQPDAGAPRRPRALTIAGSDSGGGAGIQADLKTFTAFGVYGSSVITAVTAQNTVGVRAIHEIPPEIVAAQIDAVLEDIGADAAKTGMLSSAAIIEAVADRLRAHAFAPLVVDPVMVAKSGDALLRPEAVRALIELLLPLAAVVTPNVPEAGVLCGVEVRDSESAREAARRIHALGPALVIVKGGHLDGERSEDLLFDGREFELLSGRRVDTPHTHGTGCTFSAAITAGLARGLSPIEAAREARVFLQGAIEHAEPLGAGHGPVNHFWRSSRV